MAPRVLLESAADQVAEGAADWAASEPEQQTRVTAVVATEQVTGQLEVVAVLAAWVAIQAEARTLVSVEMAELALRLQSQGRQWPGLVVVVAVAMRALTTALLRREAALGTGPQAASSAGTGQLTPAEGAVLLGELAALVLLWFATRWKPSHESYLQSVHR